MSGPFARRLHLERAIREAGFKSNQAFGRAIGFSGAAIGRWLSCETYPCPEARAAIVRVLEVSPGADCDEVVESDLDWLLEPVDEWDELERLLEQCDG